MTTNTPPTHEDLLRRIRELEKEVAHWRNQVSHKQYGLVWMDVPEAFDTESLHSIPILEEENHLSFCQDDGKPTHVLIEGDNYHSLTCLNYTHRNSIDVIYIDPPYNTGNDGFTYKDSRFITKQPDGQPLKKNHPLRHSAWLSFMAKRLRLAKELLKDDGAIFISIDDNEQANLKLLCDQVFGANNLLANLIWKSKSGGASDSKFMAVDHEYILCYGKHAEKLSQFMDDQAEVTTSYNLSDEKGPYALDRLDKQNIRYSDSLNYEIKDPEGNSYFPKHKNPEKPNATWRWSKKTVAERYAELVFKNGCVYTKNYKKEVNIARSLLVEERFGRTRSGKTELESIDKAFNFSAPKPSKLIYHLLNVFPRQKDEPLTVLDFFAGSGTTMHAVSSLNAKDGGRRQCILCQASEADICRSVTLERNRRVMQGYTNAKGEEVKGLGGSLKFYRTAFVGRHTAREASDADRIDLAARAGCLLALAENTLYETERAERFQFFTDHDGRHTAIYFNEDYSDFPAFETHLRSLTGSTAIYVFSWADGTEFAPMFDDLPNVVVKSIPQPILDIYKSLNT